jgi:TRAP-type mannitol/chloroaromatic compound transport system permease large subunit
VAKIIAYGIPTWTVQAVLPLGFGVVALRILWHVSDRWRDRSVAAGITAVLAALAIWPPLPVDRMLTPALVILLAATVLGAPIFSVLGGAALLLFWAEAEPIASISIDHYRLVTNPTLPAVPLFTLAGYLLAESRAPQRLVRVFDAVFGRRRGGPAIVTVIVCSFFTSFTGASGSRFLRSAGS